MLVQYVRWAESASFMLRLSPDSGSASRGRRSDQHGARSMSRLEPAQTLDHRGRLDRVHFLSAADVAEQGDGQLSAQMLLELAQSCQHDRGSRLIEPLERVVPEREPERLEQAANALERVARQQAGLL